MSKKSNKIMTCISPVNIQRTKLACELALRFRLSTIRSEARKILKHSVYDIELSEAYYVLVDDFNFRESPSTTQRLYELAARGIAVIVGCRKLPREFEFLCDTYNPEHLM